MEIINEIKETLSCEKENYENGDRQDEVCLGWIEALEYVVRIYEHDKSTRNRIVNQLCDSLSCDKVQIEDIVNQLNMTEFWVLYRMLDVCEDNEDVKENLKKSFNSFIEKYDIVGVEL
jgi:hypothetical protein